MANLLKDSGNRYVTPAAVTKLGMGNTATTNPGSDNSWLTKIDDKCGPITANAQDKIGNKVTGEYFTIGANVVSSTAGTGATITVKTTGNCKTHSSGIN